MRAAKKKAPAVTEAIIRPRSRTQVTEYPKSIPVFYPAALPDGLQICPYRSWDGAPLLVVIRNGVSPFPPIRIPEMQSSITDDPFPYSDKWLAGYHHAWLRGVYNDPNFAQRGDRFQRRYFAIDSHGRLIFVAVCSEAEYEEAIENCRAALISEDPIIRPRDRKRPQWF